MEKNIPISQIPFFDSVNQDTCSRLAAASRISGYDRGKMIYRAKEPVKKICFQLQGKSILYNVTHSGSRKIMNPLCSAKLLRKAGFWKFPPASFCGKWKRIFLLQRL